MSIKPWMHKDSIEYIENYSNNKQITLLEFGSGNSTIYYENICNKIYSVEHNKIWYDKIKNQLTKTNYKLQEINYISKPPINHKFYNVDKITELFPDIIGECIDVLIIDGIDRVNCFFGSINNVKKGGLIVLDDSNRIECPNTDGTYKPIKDYCENHNYTYYKFRSNDRNTDIWIKC
jgi:hypothetical protein